MTTPFTLPVSLVPSVGPVSGMAKLAPGNAVGSVGAAGPVHGPGKVPSLEVAERFRSLMVPAEAVRVDAATSKAGSTEATSRVDEFRFRFQEMMHSKVDVERHVQNLPQEMQTLVRTQIQMSEKQLEMTVLAMGFTSASEAKRSIQDGTKTLMQS
jgi:hypothetical protein